MNSYELNELIYKIKPKSLEQFKRFIKNQKLDNFMIESIYFGYIREKLVSLKLKKMGFVKVYKNIGDDLRGIDLIACDNLGRRSNIQVKAKLPNNNLLKNNLIYAIVNLRTKEIKFIKK